LFHPEEEFLTQFRLRGRLVRAGGRYRWRQEDEETRHQCQSLSHAPLPPNQRFSLTRRPTGTPGTTTPVGTHPSNPPPTAKIVPSSGPPSTETNYLNVEGGAMILLNVILACLAVVVANAATVIWAERLDDQGQNG